MKKIFIAFMLMICVQSKVYAEDFNDVKFVSNYDGDTLTVNIPWIESEIFGRNISVRISGIDTPEMKGECRDEKELAKIAKEIVANMIGKSQRLDLKNCVKDKYFRLNCDVYADGNSISEALLDSEVAVPYDGGTKLESWCE